MAEFSMADKLADMIAILDDKLERRMNKMDEKIGDLQEQIKKSSRPSSPKAESEPSDIPANVNANRGSGAGLSDDFGFDDVYDTSDRSFLATISRNKNSRQRNSLFPQNLRGRGETNNVQQASLVVPVFSIDEKEKVSTLTERSFQYLNRLYNRYLVESPDTRLKMVGFLSTNLSRIKRRRLLTSLACSMRQRLLIWMMKFYTRSSLSTCAQRVELRIRISCGKELQI
jgi:hypothetical protein